MPEGRRFKPGQSGNPAGRPKVAGEIRDLAREHTPEVIKMLAALVKEADSDSARIAAGKELLDRGWGRAPQSVELAGPEGAGLTIQILTLPPEKQE